MPQQVIFTNAVATTLAAELDRLQPNRVFVLTDENTVGCVWPELAGQLPQATVITIPAGDDNKNLATLSRVWQSLQDNGATRKSVLVNLGGGMVTDLGGFAAATFKRGMRFINVPTSLLGAVDAAVGGKTGINFNDLKNEIGTFKEAETVIISTRFFSTLPESELKSGFAEMLKHGLLDSKDAYRHLLASDFQTADAEQQLTLLEQSVNVKRRIVELDPCEKGLRRALNLGHTVGHAFESLALHRNRPIAHGYAVAWGLVAEAVLSHIEMQFPSTLLYELVATVYRIYGAFPITCDDYPTLLRYMRHDKKSEHGEYNFSLLRDIGDVVTGHACDEETVKTALDIYRDLMHI